MNNVQKDTLNNVQRKIDQLDPPSQALFKRFTDVFIDMLEVRQSRKRAKTDYEVAKLNLEQADDSFKRKGEQMLQLFEEEESEQNQKKD